MSGFDRLKEMLKEWTEKHKEDEAFTQTVNYLLERSDLESKFLNEEKTLDGLNDFIHEKGRKHLLNGWCYVTNEVVYCWAVMYFTFPNSFLKINTKKEKSNKQKNNTENKSTSKNKVVSLEEAKKKVEEKKQTEQLSIFGGVAQ